MTQRRRISGAELTANATQHVGMLNAEKCVKYLRGIGVEIEDATAESWLDVQAAHRFLKSERSIWRRGEVWRCRCGEMEGFRETGRGRHRVKRDKPTEPRKPNRCESCGTGFVSMSTVFAVTRGGSLRDYRRGVDAVVPLRLDEYMGGLA